MNGFETLYLFYYTGIFKNIFNRGFLYPVIIYNIVCCADYLKESVGACDPNQGCMHYFEKVGVQLLENTLSTGAPHGKNSNN